jgi:hypothetical protein
MEMLTALDDLEAAWDKLASVPLTTLSAGQVLAVLDRLETQRRRQPAIEHTLLNHLQAQATAKDMGAKSWRAVLAQRLGISGPDAGRRIAEAAVLGPRRALTGEPLEPHLPATATAQARGEIGTDHVTIIRDFIDHLPADVDLGTRTAAEAQLGGLAGGLTPEGLRKLARQLLGYLDSDGTLDDDRDHARKRSLTLGPQGLDGMSRLTGWITPELRATLDALFATLAAPGPTDTDTRSPAQRTHDALHTICQAIPADTLGQHNGLPVTIVATTTLAELTAATGTAHTGGGTRLPIPTLIRMAATTGTHPYLALFDNPHQLQLYYGRTRRTASPAQRLALHALERGCTKPGCTAGPYDCQVHHAQRDWQHGGNTDINELTLACGCDNRLVNTTPTGWTTRKRRSDNRTEWIPPPHLDRGQHRINHYHHPDDLLRPDELLRPDDDDPG